MWFPGFQWLSIGEHYRFVLQPSKQLLISMNLIIPFLYSLKLAGEGGSEKNKKKNKQKRSKWGNNMLRMAVFPTHTSTFFFFVSQVAYRQFQYVVSIMLRTLDYKHVQKSGKLLLTVSHTSFHMLSPNVLLYANFQQIPLEPVFI